MTKQEVKLQNISVGLLKRLKDSWQEKNAKSTEQKAAESGSPTEAQRDFAERLKEEIARKEEIEARKILEGQDPFKKS